MGQEGYRISIEKSMRDLEGVVSIMTDCCVY